MITHLLDTSVYSQRLRPRPLASVIERWRKLGDARLAISGICQAEIVYGLAKKDSERLWVEYREYLENALVLLPVDGSVATRFGRLKAVMEGGGLAKADFDLMIAATALTRDLTLATLNLRHFDGIPGLVVEDWSVSG